MKNIPVVVYGASGYTGKLICEALRNYEIPFVAAGRNAERVEEAMKTIPGIETAQYKVVEVEHNVEALTELFAGSQVVCNTVGPFRDYGEPVVAAAAKADIHYIDTTGEVLFMEAMKSEYGNIFKEKDKVLAPAVAFMHSSLEIAARVVLETPGIDTLEGVCSASGVPTKASTQTIIGSFNIADQSWYLKNGKRVYWPVGQGYDVALPGGVLTQLSHPWGGSTLPIIFEDDPRVRNLRVVSGFEDRDMMQNFISLQQTFEKEWKHLSEEEQREKLSFLADQAQGAMPPRENPLVHRCLDHVVGRGGNITASCTIRSFMCYYATGVIQAAVANFLVGGRQLTSGYTSACQAVGHRELFGQMRNFGIAEMECSQGAI